MNAIESFQHIAERFPEALPQITEFPSGAAMLDIVIGGVDYCAEYLPSFDSYGLSKASGASPFWEGFEQSFTSADQLEQKIAEMMNARKASTS